MYALAAGLLVTVRENQAVRYVFERGRKVHLRAADGAEVLEDEGYK